jgi:hypothetical protein
MLSFTTRILILFSVAQLHARVEAQSSPGSISSEDWAKLSQAVGGRLFSGSPFAEPCFSGDFTSPACTAIQDGYLNESELSFYSSSATVLVLIIRLLSQRLERATLART